MKIAGLAAAAGVLILAAAYGYFWYSPDPGAPKLSAEAVGDTIRVGETTRHYLAYRPRDLAPGAPLVIVLHGTALDGRIMRRWTGYEFDALADEKHFAVIYPDGIAGAWKGCRRYENESRSHAGVDDVAFLRALIDTFAAQGIDPKRVYVVGYSNGGQMAFRLLADAPGVIAGIAVAATSLPTPDNSVCAAPAGTPHVMIVHGTADPINPYGGGQNSLFGLQSRGTVLSARATADLFAKAGGIDSAPVTTRLPHRDGTDPTAVTRLTWSRDGKPAVVFDTVDGGGHVVPQPRFRYPRLLGRTTADVDMPLEAVAFFGL